VLSVFALHLCACGGSSSATTAGGTGNPSPVPAAPTIGGAMAEYEVPVDDAALAPYAKYQVTDVVWATNGKGRLTLEYTLPAELAGKAQLLNFEGADGVTALPATLTGAAGTAACDLAGARVTCQETLTGITVDLAAIDAQNASGALLPERAAISHRFAVDPIGILRFDP
jgi:hypothetical protein